ncbi:hypothetical protein HMPREF0044_1301 [Gleimia coleocanis DSM 15436]|uniref:Uncharacterized protein n=1 Tax=Gleimia coleocanis DSM 15436 TaxID=525245 RepID=C0W1L1_9ACTO|nr:hypothetical protein [Gleimia coleocanis]EEH63377.1 hypothetical protein HMPREF0044_1301 [Gleimia coleocanis DSM 15436]
MFVVVAVQLDNHPEPALYQRLESLNPVYISAVDGGTETYAVYQDGETTLKAIKATANSTNWLCGVGIGQVDLDALGKGEMKTSPGFRHALQAANLAKKASVPFAIKMRYKSEILSSLQALLRLKYKLITERTDRQKEVVSLREVHDSATQTAELMEVSKAAISKVLKAANWDLEKDTDLLAIRLLSGLGI